MATIYRCDRCGHEFELNGDKLFQVTLPAGRDMEWNRMFDLCDSCLRAVYDCLKPLPKERRA